jgi:hypothetical protein
MWLKKKRRKLPCAYCANILLNQQPGAIIHQECLDTWASNEQRFVEDFTHNATMLRKEAGMKEPTFKVGQHVVLVTRPDQVYVVEAICPMYTLYSPSCDAHLYGISEESLIKAPAPVKSPQPTMVMFLYNIGDLVKYKNGLTCSITYRVTGRRYSEREGQQGQGAQYIVGHGALWFNEANLVPSGTTYQD